MDIPEFSPEAGRELLVAQGASGIDVHGSAQGRRPERKPVNAEPADD